MCKKVDKVDKVDNGGNFVASASYRCPLLLSTFRPNCPRHGQRETAFLLAFLQENCPVVHFVHFFTH